MKEGNTMEEKEKDEEQEETKEEEIKTEDKPEVEEKKELETEEVKEPTLEDKYKELQEKYNALYKEKTDKDREIRHSESYKKYDLSQENINLLKRYLGKKDNIEEELSLLNKDFPHLFNNKKDTNISSSLDIKYKVKENKEDEVDTRKIGMVGKNMAIITTQSTTINDPSTSSGKADLSVKYIKNLKVLLSKRVALINATIENREQLDSGTAIYNVTKRNITQDYKHGAGENDVTAIRTEQILLNKSKEINYEIETLDLKRLGAKFEDGGITIGDSYVSGWIDAKAKSVEIYLVAKLLQLAVKTAQDNGIINIALPSTPKIDDYRMLLWLKISNTLATLKARINDEYIGTDEEDYVLWVSSFFKPLVLLSTTTLGSDSASQALQDGKIVEIGGIKIIECPWLGRNYPAGVIDKQEGFNFLGCDAVLVHKEALAFPFNRGQDNTFILQTNGNIKNFHKFLVSEGKALRPDLVKGVTVTSSIDIATAIEFTNLGAITMAGPTPTADEVEKAVIAKNPNYVKGNANFSDLTVTSANVEGKTLYDGSLQVTFTKK